MTLQEFINKYKGVPIDWDNKYGYQCVDLYNAYVSYVWGLTPQWCAGAKDLYSNFSSTAYKGLVQRIANTATNYPNPGDIIVWNGKKGGGWGHVAIVVRANATTFTVLEQNNGNGDGKGTDDYPKITTYPNYLNVLGWLTLSPNKPDVVSDIVQPNNQNNMFKETIINLLSQTKFWYPERDKVFKNGDAAYFVQEYTMAWTAIEDLKAQTERLNGQVDILTGSNNSLIQANADKESKYEELVKANQKLERENSRLEKEIGEKQASFEYVIGQQKAGIEKARAETVEEYRKNQPKNYFAMFIDFLKSVKSNKLIIGATGSTLAGGFALSTMDMQQIVDLLTQFNGGTIGATALLAGTLLALLTPDNQEKKQSNSLE